MAQNDIGSINPNTTSGTDLAALLTNFAATYDSGNSGTTRPSWITAGGFWVDTSVAGSMRFRMYMGGTLDVVLFSVNTVSGVVTFAGTVTGTTGPAYALASNFIQGVYSIGGGGPFSNSWDIYLVNDTANPGANQVYGTDGSGTRGWQPTPTRRYKRNTLALLTSTTWTAPGDCTAALITVASSGGGVGAYGGMLQADCPITPGYGYPVTVGAGGNPSAFAGLIYCDVTGLGNSIGGGAVNTGLLPLTLPVPFEGGIVVIEWIGNST